MTAYDEIHVVGIRGHGHHGVFEHEKRDGQEFAVDVVLRLSTASAAASDDLAATVDYGAVAQRVHELIVGPSVDLVETLAQRIADACLAWPAVHSVVVAVHKPHAPIPVPFDDVVLRIERSTRRAAFSIGSNLGDRLAALQGATDSLCALGTVVGVSSVYETEPVGGPDQGAFLNAVVVIDTELPPQFLLDAALDIEQQWGRTREVHWGPRTLDVDVLAVGPVRSGSATLTLPHPRAHERAFVLVPWAEADPSAEILGLGRVVDLLAGLDAGGVALTDLRVDQRAP